MLLLFWNTCLVHNFTLTALWQPVRRRHSGPVICVIMDWEFCLRHLALELSTPEINCYIYWPLGRWKVKAERFFESLCAGSIKSQYLWRFLTLYNIEICDALWVYYCDSEMWLGSFNVHFIIKLWDIKEALYEADIELEAADL